MDGLPSTIDELCRATEFSGVVRVDRDGESTFTAAYGLADRAWAIPNTVETRFATASATKTFTALAVVSLIEDGRLGLETTARSVLGADLPLIDDRVTIAHLLSHRSGIGDYLDDDLSQDPTVYPMSIPVQELGTTKQFLPVLDGFPQVFEPGTDFSYCNGGFMVLALIAERASGTEYHDLVHSRVCQAAGMDDTAFLRSDELPGGVATGYLAVDGLRTNIFHLPIRGNGDGGIYTTVADMHSFWEALYAGRIVSLDWVRRMTTPYSSDEFDRSYGYGLWLQRSGNGVWLEGSDIGVMFRSTRDPIVGYTHTVIGNDPDRGWPISRRLIEYFTD